MTVLLLFAWWACLACCTTTYESVTYCTSSFTCVNGVCSYEDSKTCSSGTFAEASCGVDITCRPNGDAFCCSPNSVGGTYCTPLAEDGRFNTKVESNCAEQANCVRVTHFCAYQLVTVEVGTAPPPNSFSSWFESLTTKTQQLNETLFSEPLITSVSPWEWVRNSATIDLVVNVTTNDEVKQIMEGVILDFVAFLEDTEPCEVSPVVLYTFNPHNPRPIEVTVDISVYGELVTSSATYVGASVFVYVALLLLNFSFQ